MTIPNTNWIHWLLGVDSSGIPDNADIQLTWLNLPRSWGVFALIGVVAAAIYLVIILYRREVGTCSGGAKRFLSAVRIVVIFVLAGVFLAPAITYTQRRVLQPLIVLLRDDSQSMRTKDRYVDDESARLVARAVGRSVKSIRQARPTRAELVDELLGREDSYLLRQLERSGRVRAWDFASDVKQVEIRPARAQSTPLDSAGTARPQTTDSVEYRLPRLQAQGPATDLVGAISDGLMDPVTAAIVLFTDGQHTSQDAGKDNLRSLAAKARRQRVPLLIVGVGDPARPRNLEVSDVYADPQVWKGDPFEIQAVLRAEGAAGETVTVKLMRQQITETAEPSAWQLIERREISLPDQSARVRLTFTHTVQVSGRYAYTVRAEPIENESSEEDNQPVTPLDVKVLGQQARVLLIAGSSTWDYRCLQRLLEREKTVNLTCWLQTMDQDRSQEGNTKIEQLPVTREELFQYDVIFMLDPNPDGFEPQWITLVNQFVSEHAGGLLFMAGPKFSSRFLADGRTEKMREILPVQLSDVGAMEVTALLSTRTRSWPLDIVESNVDHPIMRFFPDAGQTMARWKKFPGPFWSFPVRRPKPAARVLIQLSDPSLRQIEGSRPVLVTGQYGSGRTAFLALHGTWRWRRVGRNAEYFNRFWIQTTRYLVEGRALEGKRRGTIESDRPHYVLGDRIAISARLKDATFSPLTQAQVSAKLTVPGSDPAAVRLGQVPNQPGHYETTLTARHIGTHVLSLEMSDTAHAPARIETTFAVSVPRVEHNRTWLDKPLLVELAQMSGGRYFEIDQVDRLPSVIPDRRRNIETQGAPLPLWDTSRVLVLLVCLLSVEWAVRKYYKLL